MEDGWVRPIHQTFFFFVCFVFRGEMVTRLLFKTMTETVWHACWEYENMNIHTDTHKHHHNCSGHHTQTRPYTDLHFVEGLATKLPRETFNIEHPSTWPRHRELSTHWALQLLLAWNHEFDRGDPGPTCAYGCVDTTSAGESALVRSDCDWTRRFAASWLTSSS